MISLSNPLDTRTSWLPAGREREGKRERERETGRWKVQTQRVKSNRKGKQDEGRGAEGGRTIDSRELPTTPGEREERKISLRVPAEKRFAE